MSGKPKIGIVALARATFDVPYAESLAADAFVLLDTLPVELIGSRVLLFDRAAAETAIAGLKGVDLDRLLILQVTFTDAATTVTLAEQVPAPLVFWAFPEPRSGGRLRLNGLCGVNLASHALGLAGRDCAYLYAAPTDAARADLSDLLTGLYAPAPRPAQTFENVGGNSAAGGGVIDSLAGARIGLVGSHPDGFPTCAYDATVLERLSRISVDRIDLAQIFQAAANAPDERVAAVRRRVSETLAGVDELEPEPLDKSLRVYAALRDLADRNGYDAVSVRCWPEFFTDYGCAACGAMAMLNQDGTPAACEADIHGNVTSLMLQAAAGEPAFLVDLVDINRAENTGVLWHCGLAPISMANPQEEPRATIHSNRRKPLLNEFALKPGRITLARLSQARNRLKLVLGGAEMLRAPKSFSGTSGVVRFDRLAGDVLDSVIGEGLEHHLSFAYGDHREALRAAAGRLGLPVLEIC